MMMNYKTEMKRGPTRCFYPIKKTKPTNQGGFIFKEPRKIRHRWGALETEKKRENNQTTTLEWPVKAWNDVG